ncbi:hypothetical protein [Pacificispira sp.]|uniref:hypothetical protein n=1 Tax=Pacificispira sp. TaxID=2888761 RepID=UPI003BAA7A10
MTEKRGRGRPAGSTKDDAKTALLQIRMSAEERADFIQAAEREGSNASDVTRGLIAKWMKGRH